MRNCSTSFIIQDGNQLSFVMVVAEVKVSRDLCDRVSIVEVTEVNAMRAIVFIGGFVVWACRFVLVMLTA